MTDLLGQAEAFAFLIAITIVPVMAIGLLIFIAVDATRIAKRTIDRV